MSDSATITTLANGLTVVTDPMPHLRSAAMGVWVETGARHEHDAEHGLSHLLEHMAFKGTETRSARAIAEVVEDVGGSLNAWTSRDQTAYHARVLANDVPLAVDILADILQRSTYDPQELERERGVILQEIGEVEDTPDDLVFDHLQAVCYGGQAVGRPILGTRDSVRAFSRDAIRAYVERTYKAPAMTLVASGAVAHDQIIDLATRHFDVLGPGHRPAFETARWTGGEHRERRDLEQAHIALALPGVDYASPDYFTSQVFASVYGGGMSSRLFQEVREVRGLAYTIFAYAGSLTDAGQIGVYAGTGPEEAGELLPVIVGELEKLAHDASEAEVARARAQLKAGLVMGLEGPMNRCEQIARQLSVFGRIWPMAEIEAAVDAVDAAAVRRFAAQALANTTPAIALLGPVDRVEDYATLQARFG